MGADRTMKREFLTLYDYGQGGVWTLLLASSEEEITAKYPELKVATKPPGNMSQEEFDRIRANRSPVDIDDTDHPFLSSLRKGRE